MARGLPLDRSSAGCEQNCYGPRGLSRKPTWNHQRHFVETKCPLSDTHWRRQKSHLSTGCIDRRRRCYFRNNAAPVSHRRQFELRGRKRHPIDSSYKWPIQRKWLLTDKKRPSKAGLYHTWKNSLKQCLVGYHEGPLSIGKTQQIRYWRGALCQSLGPRLQKRLSATRQTEQRLS